MKKINKILFIRTNPWKPHYGSSHPLGCMMLASAVRKWVDPNMQMKIVDLNSKKMPTAGLANVFREFDPDLVGFSTLSVEHLDLIEALKTCKSWSQECTTVLGGPHGTVFGDLLIDNPDIDFIVRGEGEYTFVELLQTLRDGGDFKKINGLMYKDGDETVETGPRPFETELDALPLPAWDLVDLDEFSKATTMNGFLSATPYAAVMSTRACPYNCLYCHSIFGKKFRTRSKDHFMEELQLLHDRFGVRELHIVDDCFNLRENRAVEICKDIVDRNLDFKICFPNGIRGDKMSANLIHSLKSAGTYMMTYAVESSSPRIQKLVQKNLNVDKAKEAIEITYKEGIVPCGFFMLGFPTETLEEIEDTIKFACDSSLIKASFFTVVPFPRSKLMAFAQKCYPDLEFLGDKSLNIDYWSDRPFYTEATGIDILAKQRTAYRKFYFDPVRIARAIKTVPMNKHVLRSIGYGLQSGFSVVEQLNKLRSTSAGK